MNVDATEISQPDGRMSSSEVASLGGVSTSYVRQMARKGSLGAARTVTNGRESWTFDRDAAHQWAAQRTQPATPAPGVTETWERENWERDLLIADANAARHQLALTERDAKISQQAADIARLEAEVARLKLATAALTSGMNAMLQTSTE